MSIDNLLILFITVAPLIACAVILVRREKATMKAMSTSDHFQIKGFEANIDRVRNEVHIHVDGHRTFCAPLGHLVVEHKVETIAVAHEKKPKRFWDHIALPPSPRRLLETGYLVAQSHIWKETVWTAVETGKTWVKLRAVRLPAYYAQHWAGWEEGQTSDTTDRVDVPLPNAEARAFKSWLNHHQQELFPDRVAVHAAWDQTCAELLRACRQQGAQLGNAAGAFETWSFSAQPTIAYLVIEADGAAFWASGSTPILESVDRPHFKLVGDRLAVSSGNDNRSYPVPADRMATLRALQRRNIVPMDRTRMYREA